MKHIHTFHHRPQLARKDSPIFFCRHPSCFKSFPLDKLVGKVAACPICEQSFVISDIGITHDTVALVCPACTGQDVPGNSSNFEAYKKQALELLEKGFREKVEQQTKQAKYLIDFERELKAKEERLNAQRHKLRITVERARANLTNQRNNLKLREEKFNQKVLKHEALRMKDMSDLTAQIERALLEQRENDNG